METQETIKCIVCRRVLPEDCFGPAKLRMTTHYARSYTCNECRQEQYTRKRGGLLSDN